MDRFFCGACGIGCLAFLILLLVTPGFLGFGTGTMLYFVPLLMGVVMAVVLPVRWHRRYCRMHVISDLSRDLDTNEDPCEDLLTEADDPFSVDYHDKMMTAHKRYGFSAFAALLAGLAVSIGLVLDRSSWFLGLLSFGGFLLLCIPIMLSTYFGIRGNIRFAGRAGMVSTGVAICFLFVDLLSLLADTRQHTGMGNVTIIITVVHAVVFTFAFLQTRITT